MKQIRITLLSFSLGMICEYLYRVNQSPIVITCAFFIFMSILIDLIFD